ncbi:hypothetical protein Y032_0081g1453 [Ancylostoma ceylanicum]|uniref:Uncharacterized protein n=1 Tax=Ancylostoma ceylanicum TaxID=53326 RepID=A0A016TT88_9BILA|nr:hypothetical protein Y032_0081g1453 [Ancylostoma ceylanicum]
MSGVRRSESKGQFIPDACVSRTSDARIHLREVFHKDQSKRCIGLKRVHLPLSCVRTATGPIIPHIGARASNARM